MTTPSLAENLSQSDNITFHPVNLIAAPPLYMHNLDMISQTALHSHTHVSHVVGPIMYFLGVALPTSLSARWQLSGSNLASLFTGPDRKHADDVFLLLPTPVLAFTPLLPLSPKMVLHPPISIAPSSPNQFLLKF